MTVQVFGNLVWLQCTCYYQLFACRKGRPSSAQQYLVQHGVGGRLRGTFGHTPRSLLLCFTWLHSAAPFCIQASLLHMPGHRGDGAVCLSLCLAGRQCEHLNLPLKSSEASSFGCNFSILQSSLNFSLEPKTTLCSSRAQRQYFHHKLTLFQTVLFTPSSLFHLLWPQK